MTDLIFGISADPTQARQGIGQAEQSLDALRQGVQQVNQQAENSRRTLQTMGRDGSTAAQAAGSSFDRMRADLKQMNIVLDAVNDNFRQTGTRSKGELAVAESAINSLRRSMRRMHGDFDRFETVSGAAARGVVKDATLMQRAISGIGTASAGAQARLAGIGGGLSGAVVGARRGLGFLGIGAGAGVLGGALTLPALVSQADDLQASRSRLGLLQGNDAQTRGLLNARQVPAAFSRARETQDDTQESAERLDRTWRGLFKRANNLRVPILALSDLTFQLGLSTENLGSQADNTGRIIDVVSKNISIAGTSSEQAQNGLQQFIQAIQRGRVEAEEFNSIGQNIPTVLQSAAKGLGLTYTELRDEMIAQRLTSERLAEGLVNDGARVDEQFRKLPKTVRQAGIQLSNVFKQMLDDTNRQNKVTTELVGVFDELRAALSAPATRSFIADSASHTADFVTGLRQAVELLNEPSLKNARSLFGLPSSQAERTGSFQPSLGVAAGNNFSQGIKNLFSELIARNEQRLGIGQTVNAAGKSNPLDFVRNLTFFGEQGGQSVPALEAFFPPMPAAPNFQSERVNGINVIRPKLIEDQTKEVRSQRRYLEGTEKNTDQMIDEFRKLPSNLKGINDKLLPAILEAGRQQADATRQALAALGVQQGNSSSFSGSLSGSSGFDHLGNAGTLTISSGLSSNPYIRNLQQDRNAIIGQIDDQERLRASVANDLTILNGQPTSSLGEIEKQKLEQSLKSIDATIANLENSILDIDKKISSVTNPLSSSVNLGSFATGGFGAIPGVGGTDSVTAVARVSPGEPYAFGDYALDGIRNSRSDGVPGGDTRQVVNQTITNVINVPNQSVRPLIANRSSLYRLLGAAASHANR